MRGRGCRRAHPPPQETKEEGLRWSGPDKEAAGVWTRGDKGWLSHVGVGLGLGASEMTRIAESYRRVEVSQGPRAPTGV